MQQVAASGPLDRMSLLFGIKQQFQIVNIRLATKERRAKLFVVCVCSQGWEVLMRKTVTRCVFLVTAILSAFLISFPSFPSPLGIISKHQIVDRALKGDRLTTAPSTAKTRPASHPALVRTGKHVPVGCDRASSSMSSPQFSSLFGRCLV
jgi:hypothetical protein